MKFPGNVSQNCHHLRAFVYTITKRQINYNFYTAYTTFFGNLYVNNHICIYSIYLLGFISKTALNSPPFVLTAGQQNGT